MLSKISDEDSSLNMPGFVKAWTVVDDVFIFIFMYENWLLFPIGLKAF